MKRERERETVRYERDIQTGPETSRHRDTE